MREEKTIEQRDSYISVLGVVSAVAVVMLHTNGVFWEFSSTEGYWKTANIIETLCYFAVPVFFMISGATLFNFYDRYGIKSYFLKRVKKTFIPYVVFSLLGVVFRVVYLHTLEASSVTPGMIIKGLLNGSGIVPIFWFFPHLFCIYLSVLLFAAVSKERRKEVFSYLAIIGVILNVLLPFLVARFNIDIGFSYQIGVVSGYLIYPLLGYVIHTNDFSLKTRVVFYVLGAGAVFAQAYGTYVLSMNAGEIVSSYKGYLNLPAVLQAIAVFLLFKYEINRLVCRLKAQKVFIVLSGYTFALYLLHWFIYNIIIKEFGVNTHAMIYRVGAPFLIFAVVIGITFLVRKVPFLRGVLPS